MDEKAIYQSFGATVALQRAASGKTQEQVAREIGISRPSLANIERGNQRVFLHQILALVEALGLDSAHRIVPDRGLAHATKSKVIKPTTGARNLSRNEKNLVNQIFSSTSVRGEGISK